jgi:uncharacterized protein (DUF1697 family)
MSFSYVALLRGINVGGKNILPMKELAQLFLDAGCREASTYIQSGNVLYNAKPALAPKVPALVAKEIETRFGIRTRLVTRSKEELDEAIANNPFLKAARDEKPLSLIFLADLPKPEAVKQLDPLRSPSDEYVVRGREIYVYQPNGVGNSKLTNAYFDSKLSTVSTGRNWRTVLKLQELMGN